MNLKLCNEMNYKLHNHEKLRSIEKYYLMMGVYCCLCHQVHDIGNFVILCYLIFNIIDCLYNGELVS